MVDMQLLRRSLADLDEETVLRLAGELAGQGEDEAGWALEACQDAMKEVGDRFEAGEYYLSELLFASVIMEEVLDVIKPLLNAGVTGGKGKIILCTVQGDIHDIGKNIVRSMLEATGFEVIDLGIDVPPEKIVSAVEEGDIRILGLSGVLTLALDSMKDVVDSLTKAGIRDRVRIIIGGNPVTEEACKVIGADDWANSPYKGVSICSAWAAEA